MPNVCEHYLKGNFDFHYENVAVLMRILPHFSQRYEVNFGGAPMIASEYSRPYAFVMINIARNNIHKTSRYVTKTSGTI